MCNVAILCKFYVSWIFIFRSWIAQSCLVENNEWVPQFNSIKPNCVIQLLKELSVRRISTSIFAVCMYANPTDCWWRLTWDLAYMSNTASTTNVSIIQFRLSCNATYLQNNRPSASRVKQNLVKGSGLSNTPVFSNTSQYFKKLGKKFDWIGYTEFCEDRALKIDPYFPTHYWVTCNLKYVLQYLKELGAA